MPRELPQVAGEFLNLEFSERVLARSAVVGVIGLGYVGLPLAMAFAKAGFHVIGVDVDAARVEGLRRGLSHIIDIPAAEIADAIRRGSIDPVTEPMRLREADVIFVCVPTPFDRAKAPDLRYVEAAASSLTKVLRREQLVILESTTYPGTTEEVLVQILERSGLKAGSDFFVAFSPERIDPGNRTFSISNTPKVVGGIDGESTDRAALVLQQVVAPGLVHRVSGPRVAELTKLLENTFRAVNIALVNELAMLCDRMSIDVWEVIAAARTKPYGFMPFYPGPGVGGHCIPVDPYYLSWKAREFDFSTKFIEIAAEINREMPFFVVQKLSRILREGGTDLLEARILVIGASFKRDIDDFRNSPAIRTMEILASAGARVSYHDPYVPLIRLGRGLYGSPETTELRSVDLTEAEVASADCIAVLVGHTGVDYGLVARHGRLIFDVVNALAGVPRRENVRRL